MSRSAVASAWHRLKALSVFMVLRYELQVGARTEGLVDRVREQVMRWRASAIQGSIQPCLHVVGQLVEVVVDDVEGAGAAGFAAADDLDPRDAGGVLGDPVRLRAA